MPSRRYLQFRWFFILIAVVMMVGCGRIGLSKSEKYRETRMLMATVVHLDVCKNKGNENILPLAYSEAWDRLEEIGWRMNVFDEQSDIAKINNTVNEPVTVQKDTYEVLERAVYYNLTTEGAFDITIWPLIELWQESERKDVLPSHEVIQNVKKAVGVDNIQLLSKNQVKRVNDQTKLDLGGIAKGYAIDETARIFRKHRILNFFIDAGGDIYAGGVNCLNQPWRVGIKDPEDQSQLVGIVHVSNAAVTTSGNYEQHYTILGKEWSHIINPNTGYPQKEVVSATVIAPQAIDADALSTALTVMGSRAGTAHIDALDDQYASLIIEKNVIQHVKSYESRTFKNYKIQDVE